MFRCDLKYRFMRFANFCKSTFYRATLCVLCVYLPRGRPRVWTPPAPSNAVREWSPESRAPARCGRNEPREQVQDEVQTSGALPSDSPATEPGVHWPFEGQTSESIGLQETEAGIMIDQIQTGLFCKWDSCVSSKLTCINIKWIKLNDCAVIYKTAGLTSTEAFIPTREAWSGWTGNHS